MRIKSLKLQGRLQAPALFDWFMAALGLGLILLANTSTQAQTVTTLGGGLSNSGGYVNGTTYANALFNTPSGLALDPTGNYLYLADCNNNAIRLINHPGDRTSSQTTTFASTINGVSHPVAVLVDGATNIYVLNHGNGTNGTLTEYGAITYGSPNFSVTNLTKLTNATAMAMDGLTNLYITIKSNTVIRVSPANAVTVVGIITNAGTALQGIVVLDNGQLALSDAGNNGIWIMNPYTGSLSNNASQLAGFNGAGDDNTTNGFKVLVASARFNQPANLAKTGNGILLVADKGNNRVKQVNISSGTVSHFYGICSDYWGAEPAHPGLHDGSAVLIQGKNANNAEARQPVAVLVSPVDGSVFATEIYYHVLRHVTGTGLTAPQPGYPPLFSNPSGIALDYPGELSDGDNLFIADSANNAIRLLNFEDNVTSTYLTAADGIANPASVLVDTNDNLYVLNQNAGTNASILEFDEYGSLSAILATNLNWPTAFTIDANSNLFVAEQFGGVKVVQPSGLTSTITTIATNSSVSLQGIAILDNGVIAVSDAGNHVIWTINPITRLVSRLTGQLGTSGSTIGYASNARLNQPHQLARSGSSLVVADYGNNRLALVSTNGTVTTNSFNPNAAFLWFGNTNDPSTNASSIPMKTPSGVAVSSAGLVYVSEPANADIRGLKAAILAPPATPVSILSFYSSPAGVALNSDNSVLFVADSGNNTVNTLTLSNNTTAVFLNAGNGLNHPTDLTLDSSGNLYVLNQGTGSDGFILEFDKFGNPLSTMAAGLNLPTAMYRTYYNDFYVSELGGAIRKISSGNITTVAVIATNSGVQLEGITQLNDGSLVVSDAGNHVLWKVAVGSTNPVVFTGQVGNPGIINGAANVARLKTPMRLAVASGDLVMIADSGNNRIVVSDDVGYIDGTRTLNPTNATVWFGSSIDPVPNTSPYFIPMLAPIGIAISSSGTVYDSESIYKAIRGILATGIEPPAGPPSAPAAPEIGYITWVLDSNGNQISQLVPVTSSVTFNNDVTIDILPATNGLSTYYTAGASNVSTPSSTNGSSAVAYQDGLLAANTPDLGVTRMPTLTIRAVSVDSYHQNSATAQATFNFLVGTPSIIGDNAAQFSVSNITANAQMYYTIDGTNPTNDPASTSVGPVLSGIPIHLVITSNIVFKVVAYRTGYQPSAIASTTFSPTNFSANTISFGFISGEASSDFVASPGQWFYAPVTLSTLSGTTIYSLQFNLTVTNGGPNPGPSVGSGLYYFASTLVKPIPNVTPIIYEPILPAVFVSTNQMNINPVTIDGSTNFESMVSYDTSLNLLGVGWFERIGKTNLYNTLSQDLIQYSMPHDTLFLESGNKVVVGGYAFKVPANATSNQTYQIQIGRPSVTVDGIGMSGSDVYIAAPTNGATAGGGPVNALKYVTIGQRKYIAGSAYPFRWYNAGDFGSSNIVNADVMQVFQSAIYSLNTPPEGSDFFDTMDSCGNIGLDNGSGVYINAGAYTATYPTTVDYYTTNYTYTYDTNNVATNTVVSDPIPGTVTIYANVNSFTEISYNTNIYPYNPSSNNVALVTNTFSFVNQLSNLFYGDDTTINQVAFGDGVLDVCDVYVTFRRSLDPSLTWFERYWSNGQRVADTGAPNVASHAVAKALAVSSASTPVQAKLTGTVAPQVIFTAGDIQGTAGQTVQVPIMANVLGSFPLRVLMLNLTVEPLDGSPALTTQVQFTNVAALGTPYTTDNEGYGNYSGVWLNSSIAGLSGSNVIGTLTVTIPASAASSAAYAVHFDHASASPNGLASFPKQTLTGLVTLYCHTNSSYNDAIPDSWRLRWFGTVNNLLSLSNACPTGDGVNNWKKYVAGVDPNTANDFPSVKAKTSVPSGYSSAIHWPTVAGKHYIIENSSSLFSGSWTTNAVITGTGADMEYDDPATGGKARFYRVEILP
jgi:sugar lactone lactonase YvrE